MSAALWSPGRLPQYGSSPVLVLLHVLIAVLKSFDVEQGPWPLLLLGAEPLL